MDERERVSELLTPILVMPQHDFVSSSKKETSHCEERTGPDTVRQTAQTFRQGLT